MQNDNLILALDVGTRSVVGLVAERTGEDIYKIRAAEMEEHQQRAMVDGQIHDVPLVASVITRIKSKLEHKMGITFKEAAVAAAGRALQTAKGRAQREISILMELNSDDIVGMQAEAVQEAQHSLQEDGAEFHCVGFTVTHSWLDGAPIGNLIGQRGNRMEMELIATFLPRIVVDSLQAALQRASLEIGSLTLEPIAAIQVAIPVNMRQLNLALIDIGAGTSDIAITSGGTITGYAMVPSAGDEITEEICSRLLVDFPTAERIKRQLTSSGPIPFVDVVGCRQKVATQEVLEGISNVTNDLCQQIAEKILMLNNRAPQAVMCIGGGSLTPRITDYLAAYLQIPPGRVAIRGREVIPQVTGGPKFLAGPESVTPIGIAVSARSQQSMGFKNIFVNDRPIRLLNTSRVTVADALLAAGMSIRRLYGKPGPSLAVEVNGKVMFVRGTMGGAAKLEKNGQPVQLTDYVSADDRIQVFPPQDGKPGAGIIKDVIPELYPKTITFNGETLALEPIILMNGLPADQETQLHDNAAVKYTGYDRVTDILKMTGYEQNAKILINGQPADVFDLVREGDHLEVQTLSKERNFSVILNEQQMEMKVKFDASLILSDLFRYIDFDTKNPGSKKKLIMTVNGQPANFVTPISEGDNIELRWEEENCAANRELHFGLPGGREKTEDN